MTNFTFTVPQSVEEYASRWQNALSDAKAALRSFLTSTQETTLSNLEYLDRSEYNLMQEATLLQAVHPDESMRLEAEKAEHACNEYLGQKSLDEGLYTALQKISLEDMDPKDRPFAQRAIGRCGEVPMDCSQPADFEEQYIKFEQQNSQSAQAFQRAITDSETPFRLPLAELDGVPQAFLEDHQVPDEDSMVELTLSRQNNLTIMTYATSRDTRKKMATLYWNRAYPGNTPHMIGLFNQRRAFAQLLGSPSFADYQLQDGILKSAANVQAFIDLVASVAKTRAEEDLAELVDVAPSSYGSLQHWDHHYLSNVLKKDKYSLDSKAASGYFPFKGVKAGLTKRMEDLFRVSLRPTKAATWHPEVETCEVLEDGEVIGRVFLDLHPRDHKHSSAIFRAIRPGLPGQLPEGALVCSFPRDDNSMTHVDVVTFLHEFGHMLHHVLGKQDHTDISGMPSGDAREIPSMLLERWAFDADTIKSFATNNRGEKIPDELAQGLERSWAQGRGIRFCTLLSESAMALAFHGKTEITPDDIDRISKETTEKYHAYPYDHNLHIAHSFSHLGDYATLYHTYILSEIMVADLFSRFKTEGLYNRTVAEEYKDKILRKGNSKSIQEMMEDFLGRKHSFDAFERELRER